MARAVAKRGKLPIHSKPEGGPWPPTLPGHSCLTPPHPCVLALAHSLLPPAHKCWQGKVS